MIPKPLAFCQDDANHLSRSLDYIFCLLLRVDFLCIGESQHKYGIYIEILY